jgi:hypothetical protein
MSAGPRVSALLAEPDHYAEHAAHLQAATR